MSREKPTWIELSHGLSAAVGVLRRGRRGFFVLSRKSAVPNWPRFIVASGQIVDGKVWIVQGVLSSDSRDELELRLRANGDGHAGE